MSFKFSLHTKKSLLLTPLSGFTLLELLVVISIIVTLFGVGFANFRGFQDRQRLITARESLKSDLRYTQQQALAGIKPAGCTNLNGYKLERTSATSYDISANCNETPVDIDVKNINLAAKYPGVELSTFSFVFFNVLGRGVRSNLTITLTDTIPNPDQTATVSVTMGGQIN